MSCSFVLYNYFFTQHQNLWLKFILFFIQYSIYFFAWINEYVNIHMFCWTKTSIYMKKSSNRQFFSISHTKASQKFLSVKIKLWYNFSGNLYQQRIFMLYLSNIIVHPLTNYTISIFFVQIFYCKYLFA